MNPWRQGMRRIAEQARLLARSADELGALLDRDQDRGRTPPNAQDKIAAGANLRSAIVAVIRVSAEYL